MMNTTFYRPKCCTILAILSVLTLISLIAYHYYYTQQMLKQYIQYLDSAYSIERKIIEHIPIYDDYATPEKEQKLRKYLQDEHIKIAQKNGTGPLKNENERIDLIRSANIVSIDANDTSLYFFYNVPKENRYLTPTTARGLTYLTERFQINLNKRAAIPAVKIALSSALRSEEYQHMLKSKNTNATTASTHSYGTSFDIFYDEYFVSTPLTINSNRVSAELYSKTRSRISYLLGASLRRQLRSILMETLIELQDEGYIYAILEARQRCYHITIIKAPSPNSFHREGGE